MSSRHLSEIIQHRKRHLTSISEHEESFRRLKKAIRELQRVGLPPTPSELTIDGDWMERSLRHIDAGLGLCQRLEARFSKETINIGVAGRARQGKSTLLQTLTGLDDNMIPASNGTQNTGTRSSFYFTHEPPRAEVEYYSEREFLDQVVGEYYRELKAEEMIPENLRDFEDAVSFPTIDEGNPREETRLTQLKKLHADLPSVMRYFDSPTKHINPHEIKQYVSQVDGQKLFLAVKNVKVFVNSAQSSKEDLVGLGVIDLPGLGEIALGHEKKLINSLEQEVDIILIVRKPDADGDYWNDKDVSLLELLQNTIPEVRFHHWLFKILNRRKDGSNDEIIAHLQAERDKLPSEIKLLVCNCLDQVDVQRVIFEQVLGQMRSNLEMIDQSFLAALDEHWTNLNKLLRPLSKLSPRLLTQKQSSEDHHQHNALFKATWDDFIGRFTRLFKMLNKVANGEIQPPNYDYNFLAKSGPINEDFNTYIDRLEQELVEEHNIPSSERLKELSEMHQKSQIGVITDQLTTLRVRLSSVIAERVNNYLDGFFDDKYERAFSQNLPPALMNVIFVIAAESQIVDEEEADGTSVEPSPNEPMIKLFRDFLEGLKNYERTDKIALGFRHIVDSRFDYFTHFHHYVRQEMKRLDHRNYPECAKELWQAAQGVEGYDEIERGLIRTYQETLQQCCQALKDRKFNPYLALFALIEQFQDQVIFDQGAELSEESRSQWDTLCHGKRDKAWPQEFGLIHQSNEEHNRRFELAQQVVEITSRHI